MARTFRPIAAMLAVAAVAAGCNMDVTPELFTSDIRTVAIDGTADLSTPAAISIGIGSKDLCEEYANQFETILREMVHEFSARGCEGSGTDVGLKASIQIPMVNSPAAWAESKSLYGILAHPMDEYGSKIVVYFLVDQERFDQLNDRVKAEFYRGIDLDQSRVKIILSNDERAEARFTVNDVFFNGRPFHGLERQEHTLARRRDAEIILSNVALTALVNGTPIATLILDHSEEG